MFIHRFPTSNWIYKPTKKDKDAKSTNYRYLVLVPLVSQDVYKQHTAEERVLITEIIPSNEDDEQSHAELADRDPASEKDDLAEPKASKNIVEQRSETIMKTIGSENNAIDREATKDAGVVRDVTRNRSGRAKDIVIDRESPRDLGEVPGKTPTKSVYNETPVIDHQARTVKDVCRVCTKTNLKSEAKDDLKDKDTMMMDDS
jgi:hypothetical protein